MTQRARLVPLDSMAFELAQHPPANRNTPEAAAALLIRRHYAAADVHLGLAYAMARAEAIAEAAASDRTWARWLGYGRDAASLAVLLTLGLAGWAILA